MKLSGEELQEMGTFKYRVRCFGRRLVMEVDVRFALEREWGERGRKGQRWWKG